MKIHNYIYLLSILVFVIIASSCNSEKSFEGTTVNFHGNSSRNNSFEEYGDFYTQQYYIDEYKADDSSGAMIPLLPLTSFKYVFATIDGSISLISNKKTLWEQKLDTPFVASANMAADNKQNIYIIDNNGTLYSYDIKGKIRWKIRNAVTYQAIIKIPLKDENIHYDVKTEYDFNKKSENNAAVYCDLLAVNDGIICGNTKGDLVKYSFNGKVIWKKRFDLSLLKYFAADESGNIALVLTHNIFGETDSLIMLNASGKTMFISKFENTRIIKPAVIKDDKIYLCCTQSFGDTRLPLIYVLNNKGKVILKKEINQTPRFISVDNYNNIYLVAYDGGLGRVLSMILCMDSTGKKLWDKYFELSITNPVLISENKIAFTGVDRSAYGIYFMSKEGQMQKVISLSDCPLLNMQPSVTPDPNIIFAGAEKLLTVKIDVNSMKKIIPW